MSLAAVAPVLGLALAQHYHHHDPFAGSGCNCSTFCNYECSINATKPFTMTTYRMTPHGVLDMVNKNTGDVAGDTSFVISRRTTAYECRHGGASSFYCDSMTQFQGDDSNSTDLIEEFEIEVDGMWGPYLYCNPVNASEPLGAWDCDVELGGGGGAGPITPPPQCAAANFTIDGGFCWSGFEPKQVTAADVGECCDAAQKSGKSRFTYFAANQTCEMYSFAFRGYPCKGGVVGVQERGPPETPPCNCSRVHQAVGRENLTVALAGMGSTHPAGGLWFSFPAEGQCGPNQQIGDDKCTWKVASVKRTIMAKCMYAALDNNVVANDPSCFQQCPQPKNVTSDCYLECYTRSTESMTHEQLTAPWPKAFASTDPAQGGCPEAPSFLVNRK